jgi:FixJ family two-component response regulator
MFVAFTKCIYPRVLEFVVSNITGNSQTENCIILDFNFRGLSEHEIHENTKSTKISTLLIMISQNSTQLLRI